MTEIITVFFSDVVNSTYYVLSALLRHNLLMGAFRSSVCNIYNRLISVRLVNTYDWIAMFMFNFGKGVTFFGFLHFLSPYLFA